VSVVGDGLVELARVMQRLRAECAWDAEQTHASLVPYLIEESAELVEAIEAGKPEDLREELGDVLYQVYFHADIASASASADERFDIDDVARGVAEKMRSRHPHVFGESTASTTDEIRDQWIELKRREKSERTSVLDGIPMGMPALALAQKVLGRAGDVGVVLPTADGAGAADEADLGDSLLALVSSARARGLDAERALRGAIRRLAADVRAAESTPG
jgi:XTP/dITP diphosphohydrolase